MPTPKQLSFIKRLLDEREYTLDEGLPVESYTVHAASELIDRLLKAPRRTTAPKPETGFSLTVPAGRYAVKDENGDYRFIIVNAPEKGKWRGWYFVGIQAGDDEHRLGSQRPGQAYRGKATAYLEAIQNDPRAASEAYGRALGMCGVCGRTLTDAESIARGIGPVCANRF